VIQLGKQKKVECSTVRADGILYNQIYNSNNDTCVFLGLSAKEELITKHYLIRDGVRYVPIYDDLLVKRAVILPSNIEEYGDTKQLEQDIDTYIQKWLDISDEHRQKAVWYVLLTWMIDKLHTIPYLRALGDYGCGKTRYLDVIGGICYKPMYLRCI
jgi:hypothetical protein